MEERNTVDSHSSGDQSGFEFRRTVDSSPQSDTGSDCQPILNSGEPTAEEAFAEHIGRHLQDRYVVVLLEGWRLLKPRPPCVLVPGNRPSPVGHCRSRMQGLSEKWDDAVEVEDAEAITTAPEEAMRRGRQRTTRCDVTTAKGAATAAAAAAAAMAVTAPKAPPQRPASASVGRTTSVAASSAAAPAVTGGGAASSSGPYRPASPAPVARGAAMANQGNTIYQAGGALPAGAAAQVARRLAGAAGRAPPPDEAPEDVPARREREPAPVVPHPPRAPAEPPPGRGGGGRADGRARRQAMGDGGGGGARPPRNRAGGGAPPPERNRERGDREREHRSPASLVVGSIGRAEPPNQQTAEEEFAPQQIRKVSQGRDALLVPLTFKTEEQISIAGRIIPHLIQHSVCTVLMVQLVGRGEEPGAQTNAALLKRHDRMLALGPGAVVMDPPREPRMLQQALDLQCEQLKQSLRRMRLTLDGEVPAVNPAQLQSVTTQQSRLLWSEIPAVLMPHLPAICDTIPDLPMPIDDWQYVRRLGSRRGCVLEAVKGDQRCAVKVVDKAKISSSTELDCLYREIILLTKTLIHPNITKCQQVLHGQAKVYLLFNFAGPRNLVQVLEEEPGYRLSANRAKSLFMQAAAGVAHCHSKDVTLRGIALRHFVVRIEDDLEHWTVVDFNTSLVVRGDAYSHGFCGSMPCIAPEVLAGANYIPRLVDCWAMGVVLLEAAAGLGVMDDAVNWIGCASDRTLADRIGRFFDLGGSHERALRSRGAEADPEILAALQVLLLSDPEERIDMESFLFDDEEDDMPLEERPSDEMQGDIEALAPGQ